MNKLLCAGVLLIFGIFMIQCTPSSKQNDMITHTVYFKLKHEKGSEAEAEFLRKALDLGKITSVRNLRCVKEVSPKNSFDFGLIMQFEDQAGYEAYNNHPDHMDFVENVWKNEVEEFLEVDYVSYKP